MKPDDILNAIGDVDDSYIRKAHQKSFLKAILVFVVIIVIGLAFAAAQYPDYHLLLRYNPDGSVNTGYIDPEAITQNKWTSMEYTAYADGEIASVTEFRHTIYPGYAITHTEKGTTTTIVGSNGESLWPSDYLEKKHYTNEYISTLFSTDVLDRIDNIFIKSETAYGALNQQLNYVTLEYMESSDFVHEQTQYADGRTPEASIISHRGYGSHNQQITEWKEWDPEWNLLAYAEYSYNGNTQTVNTYLSNGTLTGTRVSKYSFGNVKWREHYSPEGDLIGREVYRYRVWELFYSVEGLLILVVTLTLSLLMAFGVWEDRIKFGDRLAFIRDGTTKDDAVLLRRKMDELKIHIEKLTEQLEKAESLELHEEITTLTTELKEMNHHLSELINGKPMDQ